MRWSRYTVPLLLLSGALLAGSMAYWNEYRAASGCAPYTREFISQHAFNLGFVLALPMIVLSVVTYFLLVLSSSTFIRWVTLLASATLFSVALYNVADSYISGYAPCDYKGDEVSFGLFILEILVTLVWVLTIGIYYVIRAIATASNSTAETDAR